VSVPLTETNPAINPSTVKSAAQSKSQQQIQEQQQAQQAAISKAQNEAMDQNMDQSKNQNMQQNMNQQMQKAGATATKVGTISDTETNPPRRIMIKRCRLPICRNRISLRMQRASFMCLRDRPHGNRALVIAL